MKNASYPVKQLTGLLVTLYMVTLSGSAVAQAKSSFGSDNATRCYRESNAPFSDYGLRYCNEAIREDNLLLRDLAATHTNRGIIFAANGRFEEAMEDHNQAILLSPDMAKIYVNRGNVYHQTHEYELALADYAKALELGKVALDIVYYNRALTLIRLKRWDEARESLEKALEINPESMRAKRKLQQFELPKETPSAAVVDPQDVLDSD